MPSTAPLGCLAIVEVVAEPALTVNELEVAAGKPATENVNLNWPGLPATTRSLNVATPEIAVLVVVPESVPEPEASEATTLAVEDITVFPLLSTIRITG